MFTQHWGAGPRPGCDPHPNSSHLGPGLSQDQNGPSAEAGKQAGADTAVGDGKAGVWGLLWAQGTRRQDQRLMKWRHSKELGKRLRERTAMTPRSGRPVPSITSQVRKVTEPLEAPGPPAS